MKTDLIQEVTKKLNIKNSLRTYFDKGSYEFEKTNLDEKIHTIAKIIHNGFDLKKIIDEYKFKHKNQEHKPIYTNVIPTIISLISYINYKNINDLRTSKQVESLNEKEIIQLFIDTIKEKVLPDYTIEKLILSYVDYKHNHNTEEYKKLSTFFQIDFEQDIDQQLIERTMEEKIDSNQWGYVHLKHYLNISLFENIYQNIISNLNPEFEMPITKGLIYFINKHYPKSIQKQLEQDAEFRKSKILTFAKDLVEVIYFNKPIFDFNIFYIRNNFKNVEMRETFYKNNQAAILVDQDYEKEDWKLLLEGKKRKNKKTEFIGRWINLDKSLKEKDALLVTSYLDNQNIKIGLLPKGSTYFSTNEFPDFKIFQLDNVIEIDKNENQIFNSLIPAQTTLSPIYQRSNFIISKYVGINLPTTLSNLSSTAIEIICTEWLRSNFAPEHLQIKFQLLKTGGNFPNLDIYGVNSNEEEVAAQVSYTKNQNTIVQKIEKLKKSNIKNIVMFCDIEENQTFDIQTFAIQKIFNDLYTNGYKLLLDKLVGQ